MKAKTMDLIPEKRPKAIDRPTLYIAAMRAWNTADDTVDGFWMSPTQLMDVAISIAEQQGLQVEENPIADVLFRRSDSNFFVDICRMLLSIAPTARRDEEVFENLYKGIYDAITSVA